MQERQEIETIQVKESREAFASSGAVASLEAAT